MKTPIALVLAVVATIFCVSTIYAFSELASVKADRSRIQREFESAKQAWYQEGFATTERYANLQAYVDQQAEEHRKSIDRIIEAVRARDAARKAAGYRD